jgi:gluconokinase
MFRFLCVTNALDDKNGGGLFSDYLSGSSRIEHREFPVGPARDSPPIVGLGPSFTVIFNPGCSCTLVYTGRDQVLPLFVGLQNLHSTPGMPPIPEVALREVWAMVLILMGVVGSGKTSVGRLLAQRLRWKFADADDFHPPANVEKIRHGISLNDEDRQPWLKLLRANIANWSSTGVSVVLACSALKERYRQELATGPDVQFVYLKGSADLIARRLHLRQGHFADGQILASQLADLEEPQAAVSVDIDKPPEQIVTEIREKLHLA